MNRTQTYLTKFGTIDFCYNDKLDNYPNGLLVFMGSYIEKKYRGEGHYKEMVKTLLMMFPENTIVHVPVENKHILNMFLRMNFKEIDKIEIWGKPANCKTLSGVINKENIDYL